MITSIAILITSLFRLFALYNLSEYKAEIEEFKTAAKTGLIVQDK
jgi:hypothetical protein